jgi:hypothetical protein
MAVFARELSRQTRRMRPCHAGLGLGALEYEMDHEGGDTEEEEAEKE